MNAIMKYFAFQHLPPNLQTSSKPIGELAKQLNESLPDGPEKSAGLRKLLEAKDCFVRALLPLFILGVFTMTGCARPTAPNAPQARAVAASLCAWSTLASQGSVPTPSPSPTPSPKLCPDCNGTGRVGDGRISQTCLRCGGTGRVTSLPLQPADSPTESQAPVKPAVFRQLATCDNPTCDCVDLCQCDGQRCCAYDYATGRRLADEQGSGMLIVRGDVTADDINLAKARGLVVAHPWPTYPLTSHAVAWTRRGDELYAEPSREQSGQCADGQCQLQGFGSRSSGGCVSGMCGASGRRRLFGR